MANVEATAIETDQADEKTAAQRVKFKIEMMALLLMSGRPDEASQLMRQGLELLDQLIEEGH